MSVVSGSAHTAPRGEPTKDNAGVKTALGLSMRWWLGLAFAAIAALTALSVAEVFKHRADVAFRERGQALAVGQSVGAAQSVSRALQSGNLTEAAAVIAQRHRLSIFVFSRDGRLLGSSTSRGVAFTTVPNSRDALRAALNGGRYVESVRNGDAFVVGLRLSRPARGAVVTYSPLPDLRKELGIAQSQIVRSAVIAVALGAIVGLLIATLIAARLRRIARAAARIEQGAFDEPLTVHFRDEVGSLAQSVEQMRKRLRASFLSLAAERDRLHRLLDSLDQGVIAVDRALCVRYANGPAREFFGASSAEGSCFDPWPDFPLRPFVSRLNTDEGGRVVHARVVDERRTWAVAAVPAASEDGDAILILGDVSERERRELAEREFVTNAAHELGTPVTAIAAALEALRSGAKDVPGQRDTFLSLIERQTTRLVRLRRALLMLARAQTGQESLDLEPVAVRPLLEEIADTAMAAAPVPVICVECDDDVVVLARDELLEQILFGLTDNSARHSGATTITLRGRLIGQVAQLEVADDGIGVSPGSRDRLFDRFYQGPNSTSGFGLGLAVVRESVRALGGTVRVDSPTGGGTTVVIRLTAAVEVHA